MFQPSSFWDAPIPVAEFSPLPPHLLDLSFPPSPSPSSVLSLPSIPSLDELSIPQILPSLESLGSSFITGTSFPFLTSPTSSTEIDESFVFGSSSPTSTVEGALESLLPSELLPPAATSSLRKRRAQEQTEEKAKRQLEEYFPTQTTFPPEPSPVSELVSATPELSPLGIAEGNQDEELQRERVKRAMESFERRPQCVLKIIKHLNFPQTFIKQIQSTLGQFSWFRVYNQTILNEFHDQMQKSGILHGVINLPRFVAHLDPIYFEFFVFVITSDAFSEESGLAKKINHLVKDECYEGEPVSTEDLFYVKPKSRDQFDSDAAWADALAELYLTDRQGNTVRTDEYAIHSAVPFNNFLFQIPDEIRPGVISLLLDYYAQSIRDKKYPFHDQFNSHAHKKFIGTLENALTW